MRKSSLGNTWYQSKTWEETGHPERSVLWGRFSAPSSTLLKAGLTWQERKVWKVSQTLLPADKPCKEFFKYLCCFPDFLLFCYNAMYWKEEIKSLLCLLLYLVGNILLGNSTDSSEYLNCVSNYPPVDKRSRYSVKANQQFTPSFKKVEAECAGTSSTVQCISTALTSCKSLLFFINALPLFQN